MGNADLHIMYMYDLQLTQRGLLSSFLCTCFFEHDEKVAVKIDIGRVTSRWRLLQHVQSDTRCKQADRIFANKVEATHGVARLRGEALPAGGPRE